MPTIIGHVDGLEGQYVLGWAIAEPDSESCVIEVIDETARVAGSGRATRSRPDLLSLGKGRINFGFRIPVDFQQSRLLQVRANNTELIGSPLSTGRGHWDGFVQVVNGRAVGWLTERTGSTQTVPEIELCEADGTVLQRVLTKFDLSSGDPHFVPARFDMLLDQTWFGRGELTLNARVEGSVFAHTRVNLRLDGFLDHVSTHRCAGWLLSPDATDRDLEIDIHINGRYIQSARATLPRDDLRGPYPQSWRRGFDAVLPSGPPSDEPTEISLRLAGIDTELFGGPFILGDRSSIITAARHVARLALTAEQLDTAERSILRVALAEFIQRQRQSSETTTLTSARIAPPPLITTVIIPVYRGVEITRDCIDSALQHRDPARHRLFIINDFSPEPDMPELLRRYERAPGIVVHSNEQNLGFVRTVNRALECVREGDVVLLNSDTRVFPGWLDEMTRVAHSAPDIGTVTALSNNATIFSYPHPTLACRMLEDATWGELAAAALRENSGHIEEVPTGHGFCLLIKRAVLERVGHLDERYDRGYGEENHLCCMAADLGYRNVAAAGVLVEHRENVSFGAERTVLWERNRPQLEASFPEYTPQVMAHEMREGLRRARWPLDEYRLSKASHNGQGFVLIIRNWLGGGCDTAIADLKGTIDPALTQLTLSAREDGNAVVTCDTPAVHAIFALGEEKKLFGLLSAVGIRLVITHQLLGFSRAFLEQFPDWIKARSTVYYLHDFYSFCPRVNLIDVTGHFCDVPNVEICERCVKVGGSHEASRLHDLSVEEHRNLVTRVLTNCDQVISPSGNAAGYFHQVYPDIPVAIIPHPQTLWQFPDTPRDGSPNHIVLLGAIGPHKGSAALFGIASRARLTHSHLHFHVVGYTDIDEKLVALGNVSITGKYTPEELPRLVDQTDGRIALFLHGWPETFSYALTEAVSLGLIPFVPEIGAPADRVRVSNYGIVYPFPLLASEILAMLDGAADTVPQNSSPHDFDFRDVVSVKATAILRNLGGAAALPTPTISPKHPRVGQRRARAATDQSTMRSAPNL